MTKRENPKAKILEEHEPGATQDEVFQALSKVADTKVESKRKANRRGAQPSPSSSET